MDLLLIAEKLKELERYLRQLELHKGVTSEDLEKDLDEVWIVERGLHLSIQILLDIGNHILASEGVVIDGYADIFVRLAEREVIPFEFAEKIKGMAGFRNILVHEYASIDLKKLVAVLNNGLDDIRDFAGYIMKYIDQVQIGQ